SSFDWTATRACWWLRYPFRPREDFNLGKRLCPLPSPGPAAFMTCTWCSRLLPAAQLPSATSTGSSSTEAHRRKFRACPTIRALADDAGERTVGGSVQALCHAAGEVGLASGDDSVAHGFSHEYGVGRFSDGGIHEHAIGAELHGHRGVGGSANAGVHDHGNFGDAFTQDAQV